MNKITQKSFVNRFVAVWLVVLMALTQNYLMIFAEIVNAESDISGIGVINKLFTDSDEETEFQIRYFDGGGDITSEVAESVSIGGTAPDADGYFKLGKDETAILSESDLLDLFPTYSIDSIEISILNANNFEIYSDELVTFDLSSCVIFDKDTSEYSIDTSSLSPYTFKSSVKDDVVINKMWKDTGDTRYTPTFTLYKDGVECDLTPDSAKVDAYNNTYTYKDLPVYDLNGEKITYTAEETSAAGYRIEAGDDGLSFTNVKLTDFNCTVTWADAAHASARPDSLKDKIKLYCGTETLELSDYDLTYTGLGNEYNLKISGLDLLDADEGVVNNYYIVLGSEEQKFDISSSANYNGSSEDYYKVEYVNYGINSDVTNKCYNNGDILNILSGSYEFNGTVEWKDEAKAADRKAATNAGSLVLWRYSGDAIDDVAMVGEPILLDTLKDKDDNSYEFAFPTSDKYDREGKEYTYYVKEILKLSGYQKIYKESSTQSDEDALNLNPSKLYIRNGETITNKLVEDVLFVIDVEWIAAANQGGSATVTYELQRKNKDSGEWEKVQEVKTGAYRAETMKLENSFDELVPLFDKNGNYYEYRVVQTEISRTDLGKTGDPYKKIITVDDSETQFQINGDKYEIIATAPESGTYVYNFKYRLIGDKTIRLVKKWSDWDTNKHESDSVTLQLQKYDCVKKDYEPYTVKDVLNDGKYTLNSSNLNEAGTLWIKDVDVPLYDEHGHEIKYRIRETDCPAGYSVTYSFVYKTSTEPEQYIAINTPTGNTKHIEIYKQWFDDGDEIHQKPVEIIYSGNDAGSDKKSVTLNPNNLWFSYFPVADGFDYNQNKEAKNFSESMSGSSPEDYTPISEIEDGKWINLIQTQREYNDDECTIIADDIKSKNNVEFSNMTGVYQSGEHYYAVEQEFKGNALTFKNTRIGVINFKVGFNWKIGNYDIKTVKVNILANGEYYADVEIPITSDLKEYYIKNMPKYDEQGKIISYTVEQVAINGQPVINGICTLGSNNDICRVSVVQNAYDFGEIAHSDDLIGITLTNTFESSTDFTVYKRWIDDSNALGLRKDLYIKLFRYTKKDETPKQVDKDYLWEKDSSDSLNSWTYNFDALDRYDSNGYEYIYYVTEKAMTNYETTYSGKDSDKAYNKETIYNKLTGEVEVDGTKLWKGLPTDFETEDNPVAEITLYKKLKYESDKQLIGTKELSKGNSSFDFGNMPRYDANGALITYSLEEQAINGYFNTLNGFTVTNNYDGGIAFSFSVEKKWFGMDAYEGAFPEVVLTLHQEYKGATSGKTYEKKYTHKLTSGEDWKYTFGVTEKLKKYAPNGEEYTYYVTETLVNKDGEKLEVNATGAGTATGTGLGFECTVENSTGSATLTNTYKPEDPNFKGSLTVKKDWDNKDNDVDFPNKDYKFNLYRQSSTMAIKEQIGVVIDTANFVNSIQVDGKDVTVAIDGDKKVTISGLPIYAPDATKYKYIVIEVKKNAYLQAETVYGKLTDTEITELTLNNILDTMNLTITKAFARQDISGDPAVLDESEYKYYFDENYVKGLSFELKRDGSAYKTFSGEKLDDDYKYTFKDLPKYNSNGIEYTYTVVEKDYGDEVTVAYDGVVKNKDTDWTAASIKVTNVFPSKKIELAKIWKDDANCDGLRPDQILVTIEEKTTGTSSETFNETLLNSAAWEKDIYLPLYYYNGSKNTVSYDVTEDLSVIKAKGLTTSLSDYGYTYVSSADINAERFTITNTRTERFNGKLTVNKTWAGDNNDVWGLRPDNVYVKISCSTDNSNWTAVSLSAADVTTGTLEGSIIKLSDSKAEIENLDYGIATLASDTSNGTFTKYYYKVEECDSTGNVISANNRYSWTCTASKQLAVPTDNVTAAGLFALTNTLQTVNFKMVKNWNDTENYYKTRTGYTVQLQVKSGGVWQDVKSGETNLDKTITDTTDGYSYTFAGLPKYDISNNKLEYRVVETKIGENSTGEDFGKTKDNTVSYVNAAGQTTITNNLITSDVSNSYVAQKAWADNRNQDGKRTDVKFNLIQKKNNATSATFTKTATSANNWKAIWENMPIVAPDGGAYTYEITEDAIDDYSSSSSIDEGGIITYTFTNTYTPMKKSLTIEKTWSDTVDGKVYSGFTRPDPAVIEVELSWKYKGYSGNIDKSDVEKLLPANYVFKKTLTSTAAFDDLPVKVNPTGTATNNGTSYEIEYFVTETPVKGYAATYSNEVKTGVDNDSKIVVTNTLQTRSITIKKSWDDNGCIENVHHDVEVTLSCTKTGYSQSKTISKDNSAGVTFTGLPTYDKDGNELTYVATETSPLKYGYQQSSQTKTYLSGNDGAFSSVTITNQLPVTSYPVEKVWVDYNDKFDVRPSSVKVQLQRSEDGDTWVNYLSEASLNKTGDWKHEFEKLPKYQENGSEYKYRAVETTGLNGFIKTEEYKKTGSKITNTLKTITVEATKAWDDDNNRDGVRPESIELSLKWGSYEDESWKHTCTVKSDGSVTNAEWANVPQYNKSGEKIVYTIAETDVAGYTATYEAMDDDNVIEITNKHEPDTTSVSVKKVWSDATDSNRPSSVSVQLYANNTKCGSTVTLNALNNWEYTWDSDDIYLNANGQKITYTVRETNVPGTYTATVTGNATDGFVITNKLKPVVPVVTTTKQTTVTTVETTVTTTVTTTDTTTETATETTSITSISTTEFTQPTTQEVTTTSEVETTVITSETTSVTTVITTESTTVTTTAYTQPTTQEVTTTSEVETTVTTSETTSVTTVITAVSTTVTTTYVKPTTQEVTTTSEVETTVTTSKTTSVTTESTEVSTTVTTTSFTTVSTTIYTQPTTQEVTTTSEVETTVTTLETTSVTTENTTVSTTIYTQPTTQEVTTTSEVETTVTTSETTSVTKVSTTVSTTVTTATDVKPTTQKVTTISTTQTTAVTTTSITTVSTTTYTQPTTQKVTTTISQTQTTVTKVTTTITTSITTINTMATTAVTTTSITTVSTTTYTQITTKTTTITTLLVTSSTVTKKTTAKVTKSTKTTTKPIMTSEKNGTTTLDLSDVLNNNASRTRTSIDDSLTNISNNGGGNGDNSSHTTINRDGNNTSNSSSSSSQSSPKTGDSDNRIILLFVAMLSSGIVIRASRKKKQN